MSPEKLSHALFVLYRPDASVNRLPTALHLFAIFITGSAVLWWIFGEMANRHAIVFFALLSGIAIIRVGLRLEKKIIYYPYFWIDSEGVHFVSPWFSNFKGPIDLVAWENLRDARYENTGDYAGLALNEGHSSRIAPLGYLDAQKAIKIIREQLEKRLCDI
jgi:hypothetical protein